MSVQNGDIVVCCNADGTPVGSEEFRIMTQMENAEGEVAVWAQSVTCADYSIMVSPQMLVKLGDFER